MTRGVPVLDPKVHLVGATPEKLARALLRQPHLAPRTRRKPVVRDKVAVEKVAGRPAGRRCPASAQAFLSRGCYSCPRIPGRSGSDALG